MSRKSDTIGLLPTGKVTVWHPVHRFLSGLRSAKHGFTMIELLVIIFVVTILAATVIIYGRVGELQLALFREHSKLIGVLYQAKAFSVETFASSSIPCGYGVHFEVPGTYIIFRDNATPCSTSDNRYTPAGTDEVIQTNRFPSAISFSSLPISDILFQPPDPTVIFSPGAVSDPVRIELSSRSGNSMSLTINKAGQISL